MSRPKFQKGHLVTFKDENYFNDIYLVLSCKEWSCFFEPEYRIKNISDNSRNNYEEFGLPERFLELYDEFEVLSKKYCFEVL